ncbi:DedA family protein [Synergistaceae bacterium OttesenSCG-928-D05]|nr:DedA family protein [Synergistaceae bacterium OttesenSCG-928-D05]
MFSCLADWLNWILSYGISLFRDLIAWLIAVIGQLGYPGIVGLMFLESSFFPFPSEVVVPPAGYLAWKGEMNLAAVIFCGILGSLLGALFNYWISVKWGRPFFEKFGKYFLVTPEALDKAEAFFAKHGHISTFTGRLIPIIRQYISLPAGLARMPLKQFCFYTALGSGAWVVILALVGYFFGSSQELIHEQIQKITIALLIFCVFIIVFYIWKQKNKKKHGE